MVLILLMMELILLGLLTAAYKFQDDKIMLMNEKQQKLIAKIEQAKKDLATLQEKRKKELGALAYKYGLGDFDNETLSSAFADLSHELAHEHA